MTFRNVGNRYMSVTRPLDQLGKILMIFLYLRDASSEDGLSALIKTSFLIFTAVPS